jgi:hypothetical protein
MNDYIYKIIVNDAGSGWQDSPWAPQFDKEEDALAYVKAQDDWTARFSYYQAPRD